MPTPIDKLKGIYHRYRYRKTIKQFRVNFLFFGCDLSDFTDEELEERAREVSDLFAELGTTADEAAASARGMIKLLHDVVEGDIHANAD